MPRSLLLPLAGALPVVAATFALAVPSAQAAGCDVSYDGPVGGGWNVAANWSGDALPTSAQNVCLPAAASSVDVPTGFTANAKTVTAQAGLVIDAGGTLAIADSVAGAAHESAFGDLMVIGTLSTAGSDVGLDGLVTVDGQITGPGTAQVILSGGVFAGHGTIQPSFQATAGTVAPGGKDSVATLTFGSVFSQGAGATLELDLDSDTHFDEIVPANNNAYFAGPIVVRTTYTPAVGTTWDVVQGSPGIQNLGWAVSPSSFSAAPIPHGMRLRLDTALPAPSPPTDPGTPAPPAPVPGAPADPAPPASAPASTPAAPSASATPVPAAAAASLPVAAQRLLLGCGDRRLVLDDVLESGGRVALSGTAALDLVGQRVQILFDDNKPVATATVGPGGAFATTAPLPAAAIRNTNKARYTAVAAGQRSLDLKLARRVVLAPPRRAGATVTLTGQVTKPLAMPKPAPVAVAQQTACGTWTTVKRFKPNAKTGRFTVTVPAPAGAPAALYRLQTAVPKTTKNPKAYRTFSLPEPVLLAG